MTFLNKIKARIVDRFSAGVGTKEIGKHLDSLVAEDRDYALKHLPSHMVEAGRFEQLYEWLTDFDFIEAKVSHPEIQIQELIEDYDLAFNSSVLVSGEQERVLRLIQGALRLSAHVLDEDKTQLVEQLLGRLGYFDVPEIQEILEVAKQRKNHPWLRPLKPSLTPPGGRLLRTIVGHKKSVTSVAITSDGKQIISVSEDENLKIWDLEKGEEITTIEHGNDGCYKNIALIPNRYQAVSSSDGFTLKIWDLNTGKIVKNFIGNLAPVQNFLVTVNRVIASSNDQTIIVWDLNTEEILLTLKGHRYSINAVAIISDGKQLFSGDNYGTIKVWNLETGEELFTLIGHTHSVSTVAVTSDGNRLISGDNYGTIKVWSLETREELFTLIGHTHSVSTLAVTSDSNRLISGDNYGTIKVWSLETGEELFTLIGHHASVSSVTVISHDNRLISGGYDGTIKVWNLEIGEEIFSLNASVSIMAVTSDGSRLISGDGDGTIKVWNLEGQETLSFFINKTGSLNAVTVTPDSNILLCGFDGGKLEVWDLKKLNLIYSLKTDLASINAIAVAPDSKQIIYSSWEGTIQLCNLETKKEPFTLIKTGRHREHRDSISDLVMTRDGKYIICGFTNGTIIVWYLENRKLNRYAVHRGHTKPVTALFVTSNGLCVSTSKKKEIILWNFKIKAMRKKSIILCRYSSQVYSVVVTPDEKYLIFGSDDSTLNIWNLNTGEQLCTLNGHTKLVSTVVVTPDGKHLISGSFDKTLKVWNLQTRKAIATFTGEGSINCCAVAPDGVTIVAGESSGRLHFLRLEGVNLTR